MCARGIIVYGRDGYEDGGEFVEQVDALIASRDDIDLVIADELTIGIEDGELFAKLPGGEILSKLCGTAPVWAMMRTSDWVRAYALEQMGTVTFPTSEWIRTASDKIVAHIAMAGVLSSLGALLLRGNENASAFPAPYIVKSATGFGGHDVSRVSTSAEGLSAIADIEKTGGTAMMQELASSPDDLRVYIMGGKVMFAIMRQAAAGSDKANFCQGANGVQYVLSDEQVREIERAMELFPSNKGFVSIDFLTRADGELVFNEMNCFPGLAGLVQMGWQDGFVEKYVDYIEAEVSEDSEERNERREHI